MSKTYDTYHKIQTVFLRNPENKFKTLLEDEFSLPEFEYLRNNEWAFTEKVNGTNIRIMLDIEARMRFGGRTNKAQMPPKLQKALEELFNPIQDNLVETFKGSLFHKRTPVPVTLFGEGYGAGIQKGGGNYLSGAGFCLFDIKVGEWWLNRVDVETIAEDSGLTIAPIIGYGDLSSMVHMTRLGFQSAWGDFEAEGIVARPMTELKCRDGSRVITKIKCKDFE